jgi:P-type Cu+ transporter
MKPEIAAIEIEGMHCASCVRRVERALKRVEGVREASVNLATNRAHVTLSPPATLERAAKAIEAVGFHAKLESAEGGSSSTEKPRPFLIREIRLVAAAGLAAPVLIWSMTMPTPDIGLLRLMAVLSALVVFGCGSPIFRSAWRSFISSRSATMDTLIALGSLAAWSYSFAQTVRGIRSDDYYDTASMIVTFILVGRWLEDRARTRAGEAIRSLAALAPKRARLVREDGVEREINVAEIRHDDLLRARPGEKFAVDGLVVEGESAADESLVTGESAPVSKNKGDSVVGGSLNVNGTLVYRATAVGSETVLSRLSRMVEQAQGSKAPVQRLAESIASVFVPVVLITAAVTFLGWMIDHKPVSVALMHSVAVLVIACPCALGLATPTAIVVATGRGAQLGILVRNGRALEMLARVGRIVFDKTGTLTEGRMRLTDVIALDGFSKRQIIGLAASAEHGSEHVVATAIVDEARRIGVSLAPSAGFLAQAGEGVRAVVADKNILVGSVALLDREGIETALDVEKSMASLRAQGKTAVLMAVNRQEAGLLAAADGVRPEARSVIRQLRRMGLEVAMLTGDHPNVAEAVADQVGIADVVAGVPPAGKLEKIREWQARKDMRVAMVGDGINDAAALAQADVGIAMARATDVASHAADLTLLNTNLYGVPNSITLARRTMRIIRQNLAWAFAFNAIGIPLAAMGMLNPMIAAMAMALSSVAVVSNSLRLRNIHFDHRGRAIRR